MKKILLLCLIFIFIPSCSKKEPPDPRERIVYIKTFRFGGKEAITVRECIEYGEIARNMTMAECNEAVKGTFILTNKLEDDWGIWTHIGEHYTQNIYFNKGIAKDVNDMQMERMFKMFEIIRERNYY